MAVDSYIYFIPADGVGMLTPTGETQDKYFSAKGAFEIKEFSFDIENPHSLGSATGGGGSGKVKFNEFTIKKPTDVASCYFFKNCAAGAHYKEVVLAIRKAGGDPKTAGKPYLEFHFGTVFTTKIEWSGPGDEGPEESITFAFGALRIFYRKQDKTGKLADVPLDMCWNQVTNSDEFAGAEALA